MLIFCSKEKEIKFVTSLSSFRLKRELFILSLQFKSHHEWQVNLLDAHSNVERAVDCCVSASIRSEAWPDSASEVHHSLIDFILLNSPAAVGFLQGRVVEELVAEDVFFARRLINLFLLLAWSQVHEGVQCSQLVESETAKGLISLDAAKSALSE